MSLIIAAGGRGRRFLRGQKETPRRAKVFFNLGPKPLLAHALDAFQDFPQIREIFLVTPPGTEKWVRTHLFKGRPEKSSSQPRGAKPRRGRAPLRGSPEIAEGNFSGRPPVPLRWARGGATRAESVWNALRKTSPQNEWVLVHDGARPFPPRKAVLKLFRESAQADGILLARRVVPTLKRVSEKNGRVLETVDRTNLFEAETPELARRSLLLKAYRKHPQPFEATDEASLLESVNARVKILVHEGWNPKITTVEDLKLAEAFLTHPHSSSPSPRREKRGGGEERREELRTGLGRDTHRLVEGRRLYLGGVLIPFEKGSLGHSDGDALLHALADAILGALGWGDIGEWFPDRGPRFKNIRSEKIVREILKKLRAHRWQPARVDTVILLEEPKLTPYKQKMKRQVARILGIPPESVSIKAKTLEGLGPEGEGRAVTCEALVTLKPTD